MNEETKPARESGGLPRWVVMLLIGLLVAVLLVVVMMLFGGGGHQRPEHGGMGSREQADSTVAASLQ